MHEYSIVSALLARVEAEADRRGAVAVHRIHLRIGQLAGVEPELLASAFSLIRERTVCREADLAIEWVPTRWLCPECETTIRAGEVLRCAHCQVPARLAAGDEIILERVEMEVP